MASPEELVSFTEHFYELERALLETRKRPVSYAGVILYDNEAHTLAQIAQKEGISQRELSQRMFRTKGATSLVVDKLVEKGLVIRTPHENRRLLTLTELGWQVQRQRMENELRRANEMVEEMPVDMDQLAVANQVMDAIVRYQREKYKESLEEQK